jgi:hypothetical protein
MTWLEPAPTILAEKGHRPRDPYPLNESEQALLFSELTADRRRIALFGGIVLYDGDHVLPFGERLLAVPLSALWSRIPRGPPT